MTQKSKSLSLLFIAILVIAILLYVAFFGLTVGNFKISPAFDKENGIRQGLDLTGGSVITYEADSKAVTETEMSTVIGIMRKRLDSLGYTEATISKQGETRVRIEIPNINNPEDAVKLLGKTAKLTFTDYEGTVVLDGADLKDAQPQFGPIEQNGPNEHHIQLMFTAEGQKKFADATGRVASLTDGNNYIAIKLDEDIVSQPRVSQKITSDSAVIYGQFTAQSSSDLAAIIRAGQLPFGLNEVELRSVGPTLGERALETSLLAGGIGVLLVIVFMLLMYRLPGLMADISLLAYIGLILLIMTAFRINLSLPGIAGIILSIGMAVDANVIIFERMKEEIRSGKTVGSAIEAGFRRAFTAIFDANVTTLIAAVVLGYFGTGPIKGFAVTLGIGIVTSMFTAMFITRFLLRAMVSLDIRKPSLYAPKIKTATSKGA